MPNIYSYTFVDVKDSKIYRVKSLSKVKNLQICSHYVALSTLVSRPSQKIICWSQYEYQQQKSTANQTKFIRIGNNKSNIKM